LEKGLPEAIHLTLDNWSYIQQVDYEKLPFKCKTCHEYKNFAKNFPQKKSYPLEERAQEKWKQPKRKKTIGKIVHHPDISQGGHPPSSPPPPPKLSKKEGLEKVNRAEIHLKYWIT
jgi:hypothetical protein